MKIALCFFGFPREVEACYPNIFDTTIRSTEGVKVDVYAHLWWEDKLGKTPYHEKSPHAREGRLMRKFQENENKIFEDLYLPRKILTEKPLKIEEFDFSQYEDAQKRESPNPITDFGVLGIAPNAPLWSGIRTNRVFFNEYSQWKSKKNSLELAIKSEEKYDFYILARTDLAIKYRLEYDKLNKDTLYCSNGMVFGGTGGYLGSDYPFSDLFACGNLKNMDSYTRFFDNIYDYIELPIHLQLEKHLSVNSKIQCDVKKITALPYYLFKELNFIWPNYVFPIGKKTFKFPRDVEERRSNKIKRGFKGDNKF